MHCKRFINSGKKYLVEWVSVSALSLAYFLALVFSPLVSDAQIVVQTGPFADTSTLTNLVWADAQECRDYLDQVSSRLSLIRSEAVDDVDRAERLINNVDDIHGRASTILEQSDLSPVVESNARSIEVTTRRLGTMRRDALQMLYNAQSITNAMTEVLDTEIPTYYAATFATSSVDDSGGGDSGGGDSGGGDSVGDSGSCSGCCECPDYTDYIDGIEAYLRSIDSRISAINLQLNGFEEYFVFWDQDFLAFFEDFASTLNYGIYQHSAGNTPSDWWHNIAANLAPVVSNSWSFSRFYTSWGADGTFVASDEHPGYGLESAIWNELLIPYASLLAPASWTDPFVDNPMVGNVRDFFMGGRYSFPTNTPYRPLYVTNTSPLRVEVFGSNSVNVVVKNVEEFAFLTNALNVVVENHNQNINNVNVKVEEEQEELSKEEDDSDPPDMEMESAYDIFGVFDGFKSMTQKLRSIVPAQAQFPHFNVDYSFAFSGSGSDGPDIVITDVGDIGSSEPPSGVARAAFVILRAVCNCLWTVGGILLAVKLGRWVLRLSFVLFALASAICSGNLESFVQLIPALGKEAVSFGGD